MPLDILNDDNENDARGSNTGSRYGDLGRYREDNYKGSKPSGDSGFPTGPLDEFSDVLPPEIIESARQSMSIVDDLVKAYERMNATEGQEGTQEYIDLLNKVMADPQKNLMILTAGITAIAHMKEAHGE